MKKFTDKIKPELLGVFVFVTILFGQSLFENRAVIEPMPIMPEVQASSAKHLATPEFVKGIYLTSATAGSPEKRNKLIALVNRTELNSMVIDIKDDRGALAYQSDDEALKPYLPKKFPISDLDTLLDELHRKNIYVIARLFVFQDPYLVGLKPAWAVQHLRGGVWRDKKDQTWLDPSVKEVWDYNAWIARDAYARGFDEIQFDYIRFPSDGNMATIRYQRYDPVKEEKVEVMKRFFSYLDAELRQKGIPISADLFGFAYWERDDDVTIGQRIRDAAPFFTALSPMAYPSHYPIGTLDYKNPAEHPYEIVLETLRRGAEIMKEFPEVRWQSRPWIQDFDIGANYDAKKVQAQMQAAVDGGATGWLLWNARNVYTEEALEKISNDKAQSSNQ